MLKRRTGLSKDRTSRANALRSILVRAYAVEINPEIHNRLLRNIRAAIDTLESQDRAE